MSEPLDDDARDAGCTIIPAPPGWQVGRWWGDNVDFDFWTESIIAWRIEGTGVCAPIPILVEGEPLDDVLIVSPQGLVLDQGGGRWGSLDDAKRIKRDIWEKERRKREAAA